ncbi:MAG: sulfate permease, partial [Bdellovibrionales bacterium]|nr:sulfate permease [Bdellovibrionales bacterium]
MEERLEPKLYTTLFRETYRRSQFAADLMSGVVVGFVAFPLAIAFAIASGVAPEQGLYTAIVAGFVIAVFGGSRVQVSGPTGAFIVVVYNIVQHHGYDGLAIATIMAGCMLIGMGLLRMGLFIRFIPFPVTIGFTSGIAVLIFSTQMKDFLGLPVANLPADFIAKWSIIFAELSHASSFALGCSLATLLLMIVWPKLTKRVPGSIVAIVAVSLIAYAFSIPVETISDRFGDIKGGIPTPIVPTISWDRCVELFQPAVTIALLGAIESLLSAVVSDGMIGGRHRSNMELIAQGMGNLLSPLFLGIPATGAIARTATNVKNGGRTPIAAIVHAVVLLLLVTIFGKLAGHIPLCVIAAILVYVSYNMSEWRLFLKMFSFPRSDVSVMVTTFLLTVLIDLTVAIEVGMVLASFLFLKRMEAVTEVGQLSRELLAEYDENEDAEAISKRTIPEGVQVFEVHGPLFFGAVAHFKSAMQRVAADPKCLVLRMRNVPALDASGLFAIDELLKRFESSQTELILSGVRPQPLAALKRSGLLRKIGEDNICRDIDTALSRA